MYTLSANQTMQALPLLNLNMYHGMHAGHVSSLLLMTTYIIALHNNSVLLLAFGLPFDRALPWHKLLAFSAIFNSVIHACSFYVGGRAKTMPDAHTWHHMFTHMSKYEGMEVTGAPWSLCASSCSIYGLAVTSSALQSSPG
jgi:hypothetical protein